MFFFVDKRVPVPTFDKHTYHGIINITNKIMIYMFFKVPAHRAGMYHHNKCNQLILYPHLWIYSATIMLWHIMSQHFITEMLKCHRCNLMCESLRIWFLLMYGKFMTTHSEEEAFGMIFKTSCTRSYIMQEQSLSLSPSFGFSLSQNQGPHLQD